MKEKSIKRHLPKLTRMVQEGEVRYKDIQILGRNLEENHLFPGISFKNNMIFLVLSIYPTQWSIIQLFKFWCTLYNIIWQYDWRYADIMSLLSWANMSCGIKGWNAS